MLQILSILVSCPKSFDLCGGRSDKCVDSYTTIFESMNLKQKLTRKQIKEAIMQSLYGSIAKPRDTFNGELDYYYKTMETMAPGAWDLNLGLQELWDEVDGSMYEWILPDNFHACIETEENELLDFKFLDEDYQVKVKVNSRPKFHKGLGPNLIHSIDGMVVREMLRRCMFKHTTIKRVQIALGSKNQGTKGKSAPMVIKLWNHYLHSGFLSVRILDYLYEDTIGLVDKGEIYELINSLPFAPFDVVTIHDCFRCHPNYGNSLREQYNLIMANINDSILLEYLAKQMAHNKIKTRKVGNINRDLILRADYLLA